MKKLLVLFLSLLLLVSCADTPAVTDNSAIVDEALAFYNDGKLLFALETALEAPESTDAYRIIAEVSGAYSYGSNLLSRSVTLTNSITAAAISSDGEYMALSDGEATYLVSRRDSRVIKALPKGELWFDGNTLCIDDSAYNTAGEPLQAAVQRRDGSQCSVDGRVYKVTDGMLTDGDWQTPFELKDGYLNVFPLVHQMYDTEGNVVDYDSIVVANGDRLSAFRRSTGEKVFETVMSTPILLCEAGDGAVIIACEKLLSTKGQLFSNKAKSPLFPEDDTLRLGDSFTFDQRQTAIAYANGVIVAVAEGSRTADVYFKVSYDTHPKLTLEERYPTAIASHGKTLALGTYEYVDGVRKNYFVEYDLDSNTYTKTVIGHNIEKIVYQDGWQITGEGKLTAMGGVARYSHRPEIKVGTVLTYGDRELVLDPTGVITDSDGISVDIGFELGDMSQISYADGDTLFITEYTYSGKSVLVSLKDMRIKAEVEGGIYFIEGENKLLYRKGSELGLYQYMTADDIAEYGKDFLERN